MKRATLSIVCIVLVWSIFSAKSFGFVFFSVDVSGSDHRLVQIDSTTGAINIVGSLGISVSFPDLTMLGTRLFMQSTPLNAPSSLIEVNPLTGAAISVTPLSLGGNPVLIAEGLATQNGHLIISYEGTVTGGTASNSIGDLALDGTITNASNFDISKDFDAIIVDGAGKLFGVDQFNPTVTETQLFQIDRPSLTATPLSGTIGSAGVNDLAFSIDGKLFGIDDQNRAIRQIDPITGSELSAVGYSDTFSLRGLTGASAVPEPGTILIVGLLLAVSGVSFCLRR